MPSHTSSRARVRGASALLVGLTAAASLVGCAPAASDVPDADADGEGTGLGTFPVTIEHAYGTTEIAEEPIRIVTLGLSDQDALLALGVTPIAVSPWYGDYEYATWPWAQDELGDAQPVVLNDGVRDEANPPIEEIASLEPDLILSLYNATTEEQYEKLSQIAPVVVPDEEFIDFGITWQEAARVTGEALGREDDAIDLVEALDQQFADAAAANPEFAGLGVIVAERFEPGSTIVRSGVDVRARFFEQLGFVTPTELAGVERDEYGELAVPDELLSVLSQDLLVWNVGWAPETRDEVEALPLYGTLPVVQDGKVVWIDDAVVSGAFTWGTLLSLQYALDELLPQITEVVSG